MNRVDWEGHFIIWWSAGLFYVEIAQALYRVDLLESIENLFKCINIIRYRICSSTLRRVCPICILGVIYYGHHLYIISNRELEIRATLYELPYLVLF
jgi:hypothetical protein